LEGLALGRTVAERLLGVWLKLAYKLHRYRFLELRLEVWAVLAAVLVFVLGWLGPGNTGLTGRIGVTLASMMFLLGLVWARGQGFLRFRPVSISRQPEAQPMPAFIRLPLQATGHFAVSHMTRHFVEAQALFSTMETREHVIMAQVLDKRFLLLGSIPELELGWWYIFFQPAMIRAVEPGNVIFGWRSRPALKVTFEDQDGQRSVVLSFEDTASRDRVWANLIVDAAIPQ